MTATGLLTADDLAERTGYSARTIRRWAESGEFGLEIAQRIGKKRIPLFAESELRKLPRKLEPEAAQS